MEYLEKLTLEPDKLDVKDAQKLLKNGISESAILDAIYICVGFNIINRLADAFEVKIPVPKLFSRAARFLLFFGYEILSGWDLDALRRIVSRKKRILRPTSGERNISPEEKFDRYSYMCAELINSVFRGDRFIKPISQKNLSELTDSERRYVEKVLFRAYDINDADVFALRTIGYSEDHIFEITVRTALIAGLIRLEGGLKSLNYPNWLNNYSIFESRGLPA